MKNREEKLLKFVTDLTCPSRSEERLLNQSEWSSERSFGNYDDVFEDGLVSMEAVIALEARKLLKELQSEE